MNWGIGKWITGRLLKINQCMNSPRNQKIKVQEYIDEYYLGQFEENKIGREPPIF